MSRTKKDRGVKPIDKAERKRELARQRKRRQREKTAERWKEAIPDPDPEPALAFRETTPITPLGDAAPAGELGDATVLDAVLAAAAAPVEGEKPLAVAVVGAEGIATSPASEPVPTQLLVAGGLSWVFRAGIERLAAKFPDAPIVGNPELRKRLVEGYEKEAATWAQERLGGLAKVPYQRDVTVLGGAAFGAAMAFGKTLDDDDQEDAEHVAADGPQSTAPSSPPSSPPQAPRKERPAWMDAARAMGQGN